MTNIMVTKELANALKELRQNNKVTSKDVSQYINKSTSYVSKLENGDIKKINLEEFFKIFKFIVTNEQFESRFEEFIGKFVVEFSKKEVKQPEWLVNFDTVIRQIPICPELVEHINYLLDKNNLSIAEVVARVNLNEELNLNTSTYDKMRWCYPHNGNPFIIMDISLQAMRDILVGDMNTINYISMESFICNLLKYTNDNYELAKEEAINILNKFNFYTITQKNELLKENHTDDKREELLTDFNRINEQNIDQINFYIQKFSEINVNYANEKLNILSKNLKEDMYLTFGLLGIDISKLKQLNIEDKRMFIKNINTLISEYELKIEKYSQVLL